MTRRNLLEATGLGAVLAAPGLVFPRWFPSHARAQPDLKLPPELPEGTRAEAVLDALPGKKPLIKLTYRPPNYETPMNYLGSAITPNDAFFVRYHLPHIPEVNVASWKLNVGGDGVSGTAQLTLEELKNFPSAEVVALCQCSGNRRGLFQPHVPGVEWGYGAMGCARWKGARLKDLLEKFELKKEAVEIVFDGADEGATDKTPDFIKSIPVWKALEDTTLIAYEMNGQPLPHWNGFPARIVVPGWTGTYWVKHLTSITAATRPFDGFWMKSAYRIPLGKFPVVTRFISQETAVNTPITEMVVNSLIVEPEDGISVKVGAKVMVSGVAWDGGYGIDSAEVSIDGGRSWVAAELGEDLGRFALRPWSYGFVPKSRGKQVVMARASNKIGQSQTHSLIPNPAGYHHNVIQSIVLVAI